MAAAGRDAIETSAAVEYAVAHPCHPSVFLQRRTPEEQADTFGGVAAPQDVVAAIEPGDGDSRARAERVIRAMYAPVVDVHWVTVKQLAYLEPTLVETVACMVGALLNEALQETVHIVGVPEPAVRAMLLGHPQMVELQPPTIRCSRARTGTPAFVVVPRCRSAAQSSPTGGRCRMTAPPSSPSASNRWATYFSP
jgi:hypothetical protein